MVLSANPCQFSEKSAKIQSHIVDCFTRAFTVTHWPLQINIGNTISLSFQFTFYQSLIMGARQSKRASRPHRPRAFVRFDDFEVLRAIGRGAFGKVCRIRYCIYFPRIDILSKS